MPALLTTMSGTPCSAHTWSANALDRLGVGHVERVRVRDAAACGDLGGGVLDGRPRRCR